MRKRLLRFIALISILFAASLYGNTKEAFAVTRGQLLHEIVNTLGIPKWEGKGHFMDIPPGHPYKAAAETALALGIILPSETFYPDIEATNAEALFFSLRAMGMRHEAKILRTLMQEKNTSDLPDYIFPYYIIAKTMSPKAPKALTSSPGETLTQPALSLLKQWLRACMAGLVWEKTFQGKRSTLTLHRENMGTPPAGWIVLLDSHSISPSIIELLKKNLSTETINVVSDAPQESGKISIGPFNHFAEAWMAAERTAKISGIEARIESYKAQETQALFWTAVRFSPDEALPQIVTAGEIAGKRLPISWIAQNTNAECAINGGFFNKTKIIGSLIVKGLPVSNPYGSRSSVGWDGKGNIYFARGDFLAKAVIENIEMPIDSFNKMETYDQTAIFTPHLWYYAAGIPDDAMEFVVRQGKIVEAKYSHLSNHLVPKDGYVLVARGRYASMLRQISKPAKVELKIQCADEQLGNVFYLLQAGPMILKDGAFCTGNEGFNSGILFNRHPRTIIGYDGSALHWIAIDGRDPWHSKGATLREAAEIAKSLGCKNALNLDGGGSSALWWQGNIINKPSGDIERPVPYALIF